MFRIPFAPYAAAAVGLVIALSQPAAATTVTFEELPYGPIAPGFTSEGVTFSFRDLLPPGLLTVDSYPGMPNNSLAINTVNNNPDVFAILGASFGGLLVDDVSVKVADAEGSVRVIAYDQDGFTLESHDVTTHTTLSNPWVTVSFAASSIAYLEFYDLGGDGHIIDDLTYTAPSTTPVPEPSTLGLVGLVALAVRRRRAASRP